MSSRALARYYSVLDGSEHARYLETKSINTDADLDADEADLWKAHDTLVRGVGSNAGGGEKHSALDLKAELARRMLSDCRLCERRCGANRTSAEKGHCGVLDSHITSEFVHMGEEPDLIPSYTVFFSGCTFDCVFCQNWDTSTKPGSGACIEPSDLAERIERIAGHGSNEPLPNRARNVNWVGGDPTSNLPFILEVLDHCQANIPQVWNSNMYLSKEAMELLKGVVDVYLSDFKYGNDKCALRLSNAPHYMETVQRNHLAAREDSEMIIRHLVLPGHVSCCTRPALTWIAENLKDLKVNVMAQYRPEHRAREFAEIARPLRMREYEEAVEIAEALGLDLCD